MEWVKSDRENPAREVARSKKEKIELDTNFVVTSNKIEGKQL